MREEIAGEVIDQMARACEAGRQGWNLRCNVCGDFGASWMEGKRPGYGSLAVCPDCQRAVEAEESRHQSAMACLTRVQYEQPLFIRAEDAFMLVMPLLHKQRAPKRVTGKGRRPTSNEEVRAIRAFLDRQRARLTPSEWWRSYPSWKRGGNGWDALSSGGTHIHTALVWYQHLFRPGSKEWRPAVIIHALMETVFPIELESKTTEKEEVIP